MGMLHTIGNVFGLSQEMRNHIAARWKGITRWKPAFYRPVTSWGLNNQPREEHMTISLTTYPGRIKTVHFTIETLLNQTMKPDRVVLWLGEDKFPGKSITTVCGSYFDVPFGEDVFDGAVSVESLHHFSEEEKLPLYEKLLRALKSGGYFVLTDFFSDTDEQEDFFRRELIRLRKEQNLPDDVFYHYDTPMTVEHEKKILLAAGFSKVEELGRWDSTHTLRAEK